MQTRLELKRYHRRLRSKWKQRLRRKGIFREGFDARAWRLRNEFAMMRRYKAVRDRELEQERQRKLADPTRLLRQRRPSWIKTTFHRLSARIMGRKT